MMKQYELLLLISKYFSRFKEQIKILNTNGEFSINIHTENILIKVLDIIFDCKFENVNYSERKNYDSIDLRDIYGKIAIQITATSKISKIKKTLSNYIKNGHYKKYKSVLVLVITGRQKKYSQTSIDNIIGDTIRFDVNKDIIDFTNLYLKINKLNSLSKILSIKELLEKQFSDIINNEYINIELKTYKDLCKVIMKYVNENNTIFTTYGPNSGRNHKDEPLRWDLTLWYKSRREIILPNNKYIEKLLELNKSLIPENKEIIIKKFSSHVFAFERHCQDPSFDYEIYRYPVEFSKMIYEGAGL